MIKKRTKFIPENCNVFRYDREGELDVIVVNNSLNSFALELSSTQDIKAKYHTLRLQIEEIKNYDFILIDIDPQANELMINAIFIASDEVIILVKTGYTTLKEYLLSFQRLKWLNDALGLDKKIGLIFPTMINKVSTKAGRT